MNNLERFSVIVGLGAIATLVFYLFLDYDKALWFLEPIGWIRNTEIILGAISLYVLSKMLIKDIK